MSGRIASVDIQGAFRAGTSPQHPIEIVGDRLTQPPSTSSNVRQSYTINYFITPCDLRCCTDRVIPALQSLELLQAKHGSLLESSRILQARLQDLLEGQSSSLDEPDSPWTTDTRTPWDSDQLSTSPSSPNTISTQILDPVDGSPGKKPAGAHTAGIFPFTFPIGSSPTRSFMNQDKFHPRGYSPLSIVTSPLPRPGSGFGLFFQPLTPNFPIPPEQPSPSSISAASSSSYVHLSPRARRRASQNDQVLGGNTPPVADAQARPSLNYDDMKNFSLPQYRQNASNDPPPPELSKENFFIQILRHFGQLGKMIAILVCRMRASLLSPFSKRSIEPK